MQPKIGTATKPFSKFWKNKGDQTKSEENYYSTDSVAKSGVENTDKHSAMKTTSTVDKQMDKTTSTLPQIDKMGLQIKKEQMDKSNPNIKITPTSTAPPTKRSQEEPNKGKTGGNYEKNRNIERDTKAKGQKTGSPKRKDNNKEKSTKLPDPRPLTSGTQDKKIQHKYPEPQPSTSKARDNEAWGWDQTKQTKPIKKDSRIKVPNTQKSNTLQQIINKAREEGRKGSKTEGMAEKNYQEPKPTRQTTTIQQREKGEPKTIPKTVQHHMLDKNIPTNQEGPFDAESVHMQPYVKITELTQVTGSPRTNEEEFGLEHPPPLRRTKRKKKKASPGKVVSPGVQTQQTMEREISEIVLLEQGVHPLIVGLPMGVRKELEDTRELYDPIIANCTSAEKQRFEHYINNSPNPRRVIKNFVESIKRFKQNVGQKSTSTRLPTPNKIETPNLFTPKQSLIFNESPEYSIKESDFDPDQFTPNKYKKYSGTNSSEDIEASSMGKPNENTNTCNQLIRSIKDIETILENSKITKTDNSNIRNIMTSLILTYNQDKDELNKLKGRYSQLMSDIAYIEGDEGKEQSIILLKRDNKTLQDILRVQDTTISNLKDTFKEMIEEGKAQTANLKKTFEDATRQAKETTVRIEEHYLKMLSTSRLEHASRLQDADNAFMDKLREIKNQHKEQLRIQKSYQETQVKDMNQHHKTELQNLKETLAAQLQTILESSAGRVANTDDPMDQNVKTFAGMAGANSAASTPEQSTGTRIIRKAVRRVRNN